MAIQQAKSRLLITLHLEGVEHDETFPSQATTWQEAHRQLYQVMQSRSQIGSAEIVRFSWRLLGESSPSINSDAGEQP